MKLLSIFFFALLLTSSGSTTFVNGHNHNQGNNDNLNQFLCIINPWNNSCKESNNNNSNNECDCKKNPKDPRCNVSVPEFGVIPGVIALVSSGITIFFLKNKSHRQSPLKRLS